MLGASITHIFTERKRFQPLSMQTPTMHHLKCLLVRCARLIRSKDSHIVPCQIAPLAKRRCNTATPRAYAAVWEVTNFTHASSQVFLATSLNTQMLQEMHSQPPERNGRFENASFIAVLRRRDLLQPARLSAHRSGPRRCRR